MRNYNLQRMFSLMLMFLLVLNAGCMRKHDKKGHDSTVKFGEQNNELVQQFAKLTPTEGRWHWISYFDGGGTPTWNSFAKLHDRYKLKMQFEIKLDRGSKEFNRTEEPRFYVEEVTLVELPKSAKSGIGCKFGEQYSFGLDEWKSLVQNEFDFSSIGIELKKDAPVEHFERVKQ